MTPTERTAKFCKVYLGNRVTTVLTNWTIARDSRGNEMVSGVSVGSGQKEFFRVDGMRVVPLAADCDGELVPMKDACHCSETMARAVEASVAWSGKPKVAPAWVTNPKTVVSKPVNSFGDLRNALRQVGGAL